MSTTATAMTPSTSVYTTPLFWERLWRIERHPVRRPSSSSRTSSTAISRRSARRPTRSSRSTTAIARGS